MRKNIIKQRFSKCLETYEQNAIVQKIMAEHLISIINKDSADKILELGCGTGLLTKKITENIKFKIYQAIDLVDECESYIKSVNSGIDFIPADIESFTSDIKYNLVISNAAIQWIEDKFSFFQKMRTMLDEEGIFVFTLFGRENYKELREFIDTPLKYYTTFELEQFLSDYNILKIEERKNILEFETPIEVLHHIKNTGVNSISQTLWTKKDLKNFEYNYPVNKNGKYQLTYNPIYIKLG